jgi:hypothetical protein
MNKMEPKFSYKDLLKRGIITFFFIGTYFVILQDKAVLAYFLKFETIFQILFFTIFGGLLYSWGTGKLIKTINRRKAKNSEKKDNTDQTS